jgi:hypothetical protein
MKKVEVVRVYTDVQKSQVRRPEQAQSVGSVLKDTFFR